MDLPPELILNTLGGLESARDLAAAATAMRRLLHVAQLRDLWGRFGSRHKIGVAASATPHDAADYFIAQQDALALSRWHGMGVINLQKTDLAEPYGPQLEALVATLPAPVPFRTGVGLLPLDAIAVRVVKWLCANPSGPEFWSRVPILTPLENGGLTNATWKLTGTRTFQVEFEVHTSFWVSLLDRWTVHKAHMEELERQRRALQVQRAALKEASLSRK